MLSLLAVLAAVVAPVAVGIADEAALVQIHKMSSDLSQKVVPVQSFGKQLTIEMDVEVIRMRSKEDCKLQTEVGKMCHETGFDLLINGRSLTFVFRPGTNFTRVDGKIMDQVLPWEPKFSTRRGHEEEAHHSTEHKMIVTVRSTGIHTFTITDGWNPSLTWSKDFHHTHYFPETEKALQRMKVSTAVKNINLCRNRVTKEKGCDKADGYYRCYRSSNEDHCLALRGFEMSDMTEPYVSTGVPEVSDDFVHCDGWGDPHYLTYMEEKHHFQGIGTYEFSAAPKYGMKVQVFNCPLQRRPPKGGFVSLTAAVVIKIGGYTISKVGEHTKLTTPNGQVTEMAPDTYVKLSDGTEVDPSARFLIVKGKTNGEGGFGELVLKCRKSKNSLIGYSCTVTTWLPKDDATDSSGLCMSNRETAYMTAVSEDKNLFSKEDLDFLTTACCPGGNCEPPEGPEPETKAEDLCEMCPKAFPFAEVKKACEEEEEENAALQATCEFDACMECDLTEALESSGDEASNEGGDGPLIFANEDQQGSGTGEGVSLADPHCRNVRGESFDILKMGPMHMVVLPMHGDNRGSQLTITAVVMPISSKMCAPTTIQRVDVRGSWLPSPLMLSIHPTKTGILDVPKHWGDWMARPNANKGNLTLHVDSWHTPTGHGSVLKLKVGPVSVTVHQRKGTHSGIDYLDLEVKGLGEVEQDVGGLLGLDGHRDVVTSNEGCQQRDLSLRLAREEKTDEELTEEEVEAMADAMHEEMMKAGDGKLISVAMAA